MNDTIFALSSGTPPAAIALVRVSGPCADAALAALTGLRPEPRRAVVATVRANGGEELDRAIAMRFPAPGSATGEDVAELHLHGGRAVVAAVLAALAQVPGLRPAEPGEFTRRAFENGRIDLAEAEGLADLLAAETEAQRKAALALAGGALSRQVERWRTEILDLAAAVEAVLDFADEADVADALPAAWRDRLERARGDIEAVLARPTTQRLRDGVRVVIAGPPNAGKSSLLNALAGRDAAIISQVAGTTRDLVEAPTAIGGAAFLLIDTAGLREVEDPIEAIGVGRARGAIAGADLVLWLGEAERAPEGAIRVHAKSDLFPPSAEADVAISVVTGQGLDDLVALLGVRAGALVPQENELAVNRRHRDLLATCSECLGMAAEASDFLVSAEALRRARVALDRVTGRAGVEDMLDSLFGRFCIGK
ncbi:MAG TPA: tRNA uridine-5-carboxymethylaminomethyl(34) synthesis GTPase MnmE [Allosphingosinicella sp.]